MTPTELDDALDALQQAAGGDANRLPGLIGVQTDDWIARTSAVGAKCARLDDGLRHRDIQIHIGAQQKTTVLTRAEAGDRGAPYRDLTPRG